MNNYWDDDWDYELFIRVQTDKSSDEFVNALKIILDPIEIDEGAFEIGGIKCVIENSARSTPLFSDVPNESYSYLIKVPISTEIIKSAIDKPFVIALSFAMRVTFRCKYLITADDSFFVLFSGTNLPFYINKRFRPWDNELRGFLKGQKIVELSI